MRTEDGYIISKCLNGEVEAFGLLVDKYKESIYALAYSKLGNFQDAEDVTQEAFTRAFQKLHTLRWWDNFVAWMYAITSNLCKDWIRARSRRPDREFVEDQERRVLSLPSLQSYRERQVSESLREALESLPQTYRQVLVLHYMGGMEIQEMARFLGTSPSTISRRLRKARSRLKAEMLPTFDGAFDGQRLPAGFTFHIVETVKRIGLQPTPRIPRLPLGITAAAAIILTLLTFSPQFTHSRHALPLGLLGKIEGLAVWGFYTDAQEISEPEEKIISVESIRILPDSGIPILRENITRTLSKPYASDSTGVTRRISADFGNHASDNLPKTLRYEGISERFSPSATPSTISAFGASSASKSMFAGQDTVKSGHPAVIKGEIGEPTPQSTDMRLLKRLGMGRINAVAWSGNGRLLAAGTDTGVHLISPETLEVFSLPDASGEKVSSVAFNPRNALLASASGKTIRLWNYLDGSCINMLEDHSGTVNSIAFSSDGLLLVSGSDDRTVKFWETASGECIKTLSENQGVVRAVAFSSDGSMVASGDGKVVKLWSLPDGKCSHVLEGHRDIVNAVAFSPDGSAVASGSADGHLKLWSVSDGQCLTTASGTSLSRLVDISSISFNPDGSMICVGNMDGDPCLLNGSKGRFIRTLLGGGHRAPISVAFSPDGSVLASGGADGLISLWDLPKALSDDCIATLTDTTRPYPISNRVFDLVFSPDGGWIASAGESNEVKLWSVAERACVTALKGHRGDIRSVIFSPDGSMIASRSDDNTIKVWNLVSGERLADLNVWGGEGPFAFSPDGAMLAVGGSDRSIGLWRVSDGRLVASLKGHDNSVSSMAFSPDGLILASADGANRENHIKLWSVPGRKCVRTLEDSGAGTGQMAFTSDGSTLVVVTEGYTRLWDTSTYKCVASLTGRGGLLSPDASMVARNARNSIGLYGLPDGAAIGDIYTRAGSRGYYIKRIAISPDNSTVASADWSGEIRLWKVPDSKRVSELGGHRGGVRCISISWDDSTVATGGSDGMIRLWDTTSGESITDLLGHSGSVNSVAFSPDGSMMASGGKDESVRVWDTSSGKMIVSPKGHEGVINSVAFSTDGLILASGGEDRTIRFWSLPDGKCIGVLKGHRDIGWLGIKGSVFSVTFSPAGSLIASGSEDKTVRLWNMSDGKCVAVLKGHQGCVRSVAFSPDGSLVASGSDDCSIRIWKARDRECIANLRGYNKPINSVAFSPDGRLIASGGSDGTIKLWSIVDEKCILTSKCHGDAVHSIAFGSDNSIIVSGSEDGTAGIWLVGDR